MGKENQNPTNGLKSHVVQVEIHALGTQLGPVVNPRSDLGSHITYSDIVRQSVKPNTNVKSTKNMSTQTDECDSFEHLGKTFFDKLKICLVELFQSSIMKENSNARHLIIDNVLQHQFGNETSKYQTEIRKNNDRNQKKRLAESEPQDDSETDL